MKSTWVAIGLLTCGVGCSAASDEVVIEDTEIAEGLLALGGGNAAVEQGTLAGARDGDSIAYRGIPYAAPPVGALRWAAPKSPLPWKGTRAAKEYGPSCPQAGDGIKAQSEDCLTLNVWTPKRAGQGRPVMVWIHGGAFDNGSGFGYDGGKIYEGGKLAAQNDVIVVTLNYRLGALGFMASTALSGESPKGLSGNWGILDQIQALTWVRENIAKFGGDASNVTIFGESAGGMSVCTLLVQQKARGLFSRAIIESGGCPSRSITEQKKSGDALALKAGCAAGPGQAACLRTKTAAQLVAAQPTFAVSDYSEQIGKELPFNPVIDGDLLVESSIDALTKGNIENVPLIIGNNGHEIPGLLYGDTVTSYEGFKSVVVKAGVPENRMLEVVALYNPLRFGSWANAAGAIATDTQFTCPRLRIVDAFRKGSKQPLYTYWFDALPPPLPQIGAFHGAEIFFVFDNLPLGIFTEAKYRRVATAMGQYWTSFAKDGTPSARNQPRWLSASALDFRLEVSSEGVIAMGTENRRTECAMLDPLVQIK